MHVERRTVLQVGGLVAELTDEEETEASEDDEEKAEDEEDETEALDDEDEEDVPF